MINLLTASDFGVVHCLTLSNALTKFGSRFLAYKLHLCVGYEKYGCTLGTKMYLSFVNDRISKNAQIESK